MNDLTDLHIRLARPTVPAEYIIGFVGLLAVTVFLSGSLQKLFALAVFGSKATQ